MLELARQKAFLDVSAAEKDSVWEAADTPADPDEEIATHSVRQLRWEQQTTMRTFHVESDYDQEGDRTNLTLQLLHAEIQLARAAFPELPLYVVKLDLKDFYPSIPHDVLLTALARLGMPERDRRLIQRFLSPPLLSPGAEPVRMRRGVPMGFTLSALLAELLLRFLDLNIQRRARVRIIRRVDDICLLTPRAEDALAGWKAVEEFCAACGLEINRDKSGAVCLGGTLPAGLPKDLPRWGMLELDEHGNWHVHEATFQAHRAQTRERVEAAPSLFAQVQ
jgi:hypothetical protein